MRAARPLTGIDMTKTGSNSAGKRALRVPALLLLMLMGVGAAASFSGLASCANQEYYETQTAARTAYEAAESARRAADAATVASIDLRMSNDRLGESADKLRNVITGEGFARRVPVRDEAAQQGAQGAQGQPGQDGAPGATSESPSSNSAAPAGGPANTPSGAADSQVAAAQRDLVQAQRDLVDATRAVAAAVKDARPRAGAVTPEGALGDVPAERPGHDMFDMDLAFAAAAFLSLVAIAWWSGEARSRARNEDRAADWMPVSAAACAAMVSIALAGAVYFGVRIYRDGGSPGPHVGVPFIVMAWVWCGMVAAGLVVMWVSALAGFWSHIGASGLGGRREERPDIWRLWMIVLAIGVLPAAGLLVQGRFAVLLGMLLIVVFGAMAGMAMLATARDEARLVRKNGV